MHVLINIFFHVIWLCFSFFQDEVEEVKKQKTENGANGANGKAAVDLTEENGEDDDVEEEEDIDEEDEENLDGEEEEGEEGEEDLDEAEGEEGEGDEGNCTMWQNFIWFHVKKKLLVFCFVFGKNICVIFNGKMLKKSKIYMLNGQNFQYFACHRV